MARRKFRRPYLVVRAGRVRILPNVRDIEWILDHAGAHFVSEQTVENIFIDWQRALREDRITELLELLHDLVVHSGVMVVGTPKHHDADAVLALKHVQSFTGALTQPRVVRLLGPERDVAGTLVLLFRDAQHRSPCAMHLKSEE